MAISAAELQKTVDKARERASDLDEDLGELAARARATAPADLADANDRRQRLGFLRSLYGEEREAKKAFERIIAGNELQEVNFLPRGALIARTVMRILLRSSGGRLLGYGSGVLIGDGVLLTNNHVLGDAETARSAEAQAYYEIDVDGDAEEPRCFTLEPDRLFYTCEPLDFTVVAVASQDKSGREQLAAIGWVPLIEAKGKAAEGEWLNIVQHPKGERKQLCLRENQLLKRADDVLWYSTDTQGGSSGSPVFNNNWLMVALHHSGVPETRDDKWQTIDGRDYDPGRDDESKIKWIANEGIRVSRIVEELRGSRVGNHPLVRPLLSTEIGDIQARLPVLFREGEDVAKLLAASFMSRISPKAPVQAAAAILNPASPRSNNKESNAMSRRVTVTLEIDDDGDIRLVGRGSAESNLLEDTRSSEPALEIEAPVVPEEDWRHGYDPGFLGNGLVVDLPRVEQAIDGSIAELKRESVYGFPEPSEDEAKAGVLKYNGFSVVMNARRRVAIYSAANINGGVEIRKVKRKDKWLWDDRIEREHQIGNAFYVKNKLDRGHLTRREDMEWGTDPVDGTRRANGTCTWTNCAPQHELFNQDKHPNKAIRLWGGLEKYILEKTARHDSFRVQCITGPVFDTDDPDYRGVKIPLDYWKVVVAVDAAGELFATGYILTQSEVLDVANLDEAAQAEPFGKFFGTYQRPITEIEDATGLRFTASDGAVALSDYDPLAKELGKKPWQRRRRQGARPRSAETMTTSPSGSDALESFADLILGDI